MQRTNKMRRVMLTRGRYRTARAAKNDLQRDDGTLRRYRKIKKEKRKRLKRSRSKKLEEK